MCQENLADQVVGAITGIANDGWDHRGDETPGASAANKIKISPARFEANARSGSSSPAWRAARAARATRRADRRGRGSGELTRGYGRGRAAQQVARIDAENERIAKSYYRFAHHVDRQNTAIACENVQPDAKACKRDPSS